MAAIPPSFLHRENTLFSDPLANLSAYLSKKSKAERKSQQIKDEIERLKNLPKDSDIRRIAEMWGLVD